MEGNQEGDKMKVRIVTDIYRGYEVQVKRWYWPFWTQLGFSNTFASIEQAELWARHYTTKPTAYRSWRRTQLLQKMQRLPVKLLLVYA